MKPTTLKEAKTNLAKIKAEVDGEYRNIRAMMSKDASAIQALQNCFTLATLEGMASTGLKGMFIEHENTPEYRRAYSEDVSVIIAGSAEVVADNMTQAIHESNKRGMQFDVYERLKLSSRAELHNWCWKVIRLALDKCYENGRADGFVEMLQDKTIDHHSNVTSIH